VKRFPDLEEAWSALHDATPAGWYVGRPSNRNERRERVMSAFDLSKRPRLVGLRIREWIAGRHRQPQRIRHTRPLTAHSGWA